MSKGIAALGLARSAAVTAEAAAEAERQVSCALRDVGLDAGHEGYDLMFRCRLCFPYVSSTTIKDENNRLTESHAYALECHWLVPLGGFVRLFRLRPPPLHTFAHQTRAAAAREQEQRAADAREQEAKVRRLQSHFAGAGGRHLDEAALAAVLEMCAGDVDASIRCGDGHRHGHADEFLPHRRPRTLRFLQLDGEPPEGFVTLEDLAQETGGRPKDYARYASQSASPVSTRAPPVRCPPPAARLCSLILR